MVFNGGKPFNDTIAVHQHPTEYTTMHNLQALESYICTPSARNDGYHCSRLKLWHPGTSILQCLTFRDSIMLHHKYPHIQIGVMNIDFQNPLERVKHNYLRDDLTRLEFPAETFEQL